MLKKKIIIFLLLFLSSCGYEAIHSKKNVKSFEFSISKLSFSGDRDINLKIKEILNKYTLNKKDKDFTLKISSTSEKKILAKNILGDATSFQKIIVVNIDVLESNKFKNNFTLSEKFTYNNNDNKFNLTTYEKEITKNLTETTVDKLIFKLSNIQ
jgi:outer membrane lipopolysaccharide assembly protein LptE/RlpB